MIIKELVLYNFGVYVGRQVLNLEPPCPDHPVILIGGLNGGGKTTILDAVQLALYGKKARCSAREKYSYKEFLRKSINRNATKAGVELEFETHFVGEATTLRICRSWGYKGKVVDENLSIWRDGEPDHLLTHSWSNRVEEYLPLNIAQLFFFDGERIEGLADSDRSRVLMETGINSLLGVDIIRQLDSDLTVLLRRKLKDKQESKYGKEIETIESSIQKLEALRQEALLDKAHNQALYEQAMAKLESTNEKYSQEGGDLYEQRITIEQKGDGLRQEIVDKEEHLRDLAMGSLPLALVNDLFHNTLDRSVLEQNTFVQQKVYEEMKIRNRDLVEWMKKQQFAEGIQESIALFLDNTTSPPKDQISPRLDLGVNITDNMRVLRDRYLPDDTGKTKALLEEVEKLEMDYTETERMLSAIPEEARIKPLQRERNRLISKVEDLTVNLNTSAEVFERVDRDLTSQKESLIRLLDAQVRELLERDESERIVIHANRVRKTLETFRLAVIREHIGRIEEEITSCFRRLLHKELLIEKVCLDVSSFGITIKGFDDKRIPVEQLSAGERQLLAVAFLWGLAIVSGRTLPTIIDTPLGRLDSLHRDRLITHYFPNASHQVLLLSTDEEIDRDLYKILRPYVGHEYRLEFDDSIQSTTVVPGYFWTKELSYAN